MCLSITPCRLSVQKYLVDINLPPLSHLSFLPASPSLSLFPPPLAPLPSSPQSLYDVVTVCSASLRVCCSDRVSVPSVCVFFSNTMSLICPKCSLPPPSLTHYHPSASFPLLSLPSSPIPHPLPSFIPHPFSYPSSPSSQCGTKSPACAGVCSWPRTHSWG